MGCIPSNARGTTVVKNTREFLFTTDERLKLKEVWVIVKQNGLKKLGEEIMNKALERNSSLRTYWLNLTIHDQNDILTFDENDTMVTTDLIRKQTLKQHGYQILDKIDQLIMIMVTQISTTDTNDAILTEYIHRIGECHIQYKIKQEHIDIICESICERIENVMHAHGHEWTIKHALAWQKLLILITNQFSSTICRETSSM